MAIGDGKYKAKATGQVVLGTSSKKGTPFIEFYFRIIGGENDGGEARYTGYFPDGNKNACERTLQALEYCGWEGEDLGEFADGELHGLDANEVEIVVELEEYETEEGEHRVSPRVQWVNKLGGYLNVQNAMSKDDAASFGEKMRGLVLKMKTKKAPPPSSAGDFPHGANAPEQKKASGAKKGW